MSKPLRIRLTAYPDVLIHAVIDAGKSAVKRHPCYPAAKSGDAEAARDLVHETINDEQVEALPGILDGRKPILVSVHAYESEGVNAIPEVTTLDELRGKHGEQFEEWWQERFGYPFDCLTQSEARYLANSPDAETIRNRIAEAE